MIKYQISMTGLSLVRQKSLNWYDTTPNTEPSFYAIVASYASGDADEVRSNIVSFSSIESIFDKEVKVGPNPMHDTMEIVGADNIENLSVVAVNGYTVMNIQYPGSQVDVSALTPGIYFVVLNFTDNSFKTVRLIKE